LTVIAGLVLAVREESVISVAVMDQVPAVLFVSVKVRVPEISGVLAGNPLFASVQLIATVSVTVFTMFQFASTAFTVIV
jgi:hypothetical protein